MVIQKHIVVSETIWNAFQKIRGRRHNDKMLNLLNSTTKTLAKEEVITKLLNTHMNEIKDVLDSYKKEVKSFSDRIGSVERIVDP